MKNSAKNKIQNENLEQFHSLVSLQEVQQE